MKWPLLLCTAVVLLPAVPIASQSEHSVPSSAVELLQKVAQHYAAANRYSIESVRESRISSAYSRTWNKTMEIAAEEPGGRSHFEGRSQFGDAVEISDGKTIWKYPVNLHRFTEKPVKKETGVAKPSPIPFWAMSLNEAKHLRQSLAALAGPIKSAERFPDAVLVVDGRAYSCAVVSIGRSDLKRARPDKKFDRTIWIDKKTLTVLKVVEHSSSEFDGVAQNYAVTTVYPRTVLDRPLPENLFVFSPPLDAHKVNELPDPREAALGATLLGDRVPPLKFKAPDGAVTPIESFRGKTVVIDFWATWCAPCVAALPALAKLADEGKEKGLVLIAVDRDDDPNKAAAYLKEKGLALTDFHDGDGKIESLVGSSPIPRELIIDRAGWVVLDAQLDPNTLRARLAELDPAFKDFAPKSEAHPCAAPK